MIPKWSQNHTKISQNHETLAQFWTLGLARNRTRAPLSGHPLTWPLGQICMVMGPEWTGMEACQTLCYGLVRISFFPTENECFPQKTLIWDQHFWSFLVVFRSRPRQLTFFFFKPSIMGGVPRRGVFLRRKSTCGSKKLIFLQFFDGWSQKHWFSLCF